MSSDKEIEARRIQELLRFEILDSEPEPEFDHLARLAAVTCGTPYSSVTFVDESRVWLKAKCGLDVTELPREIAFCSRTVSQNRLIVIPDTLADPTYANSPVVVGPPHLRFYAGYPIQSADGYAIGTICVMSNAPGTLGPAQEECLQLLAEQAAALAQGRRAGKLLRREVERFTRLHDSMRDGVLQVDLNANIVDVNPAFCEMIGYTRDECLKLNVRDITPSEYLELDRRVIEEEVHKVGHAEAYEKEYVHRDGGRIFVELRPMLIRDEAGVPQYRYSIVRDVTARKMAEQKIASSEAKYRQLFENVTTGFALHEIICDDTGRPFDYRYLEVNPAFERLTGLNAKDLLGRTIREVVPGTEQYWIDVFGNVALTREPTFYENYSAELHRYFNTWVFSPEPGQFAVIFTDVTRTKLIEEDLKTKERRLSHAISATSDAIWEWNFLTGEVYYSPRWYEILGYEPNELDNSFEGWKAICHPDDVEEALEAINAVIAQPSSAGCSVEFRVKKKDGALIWIHARGNVVDRDEHGSPILFAGVNADITERKLAEQALQQLNETLENRVAERTAALEERTQELEFFTFAVSHDLRAPLRIVQGYAQLLVDEVPEDPHTDVRDFASKIVAGSDRMSEMLEGLLAYSKIGTAQTKPAVVPLKPFVSSLIDDVIGHFGSKELRIEEEIPEALVQLDTDATEICLRNLLSNAVKFSSSVESPRVIVRAVVSPRSCQITVSDNGIGFDMTQAPRMFQMFQRLQTVSPGSGVGLALVAKAATRMGATISTSSVVGEGASFVLDIPLSQ